MLFHLIKRTALMLMLIALAACSNDRTPSLQQVTLDAELHDIYQTSCQNCHENAAMGAPLSGDHARWHEVLSVGMETVMQRVMQGYRGMPPAGQCFECSPEQLEQLVLYMATVER